MSDGGGGERREGRETGQARQELAELARQSFLLREFFSLRVQVCLNWVCLRFASTSSRLDKRKSSVSQGQSLTHCALSVIYYLSVISGTPTVLRCRR